MPRKRLDHNNRPWREGKPGIYQMWQGLCPTTNKRKFQTKGDAKRQVRAMNASGKSIPGRDLSVYRCRACGFFHVGKKLPVGQRERMWEAR